MLEFTAIAIAVLSGVAIISAKVGHRLGAKRAMREIVRVFQREIVSNDDELKSVAEHLHRSRDVTKIAQTLLGAAMREGEMIQANISKPKSNGTCLVMKAKGLQDVVWLADTGLQPWTADGKVPFRIGEKLPYEQAEHPFPAPAKKIPAPLSRELFITLLLTASAAGHFRLCGAGDLQLLGCHSGAVHPESDFLEGDVPRDVRRTMFWLHVDAEGREAAVVS